MFKRILVIASLLLLTGCPNQLMIPNSKVPAVGNSISQAQAHVKSADNVVTQAKVYSNPTGKALLNIATDEHKSANIALDQANKQLNDVQKAYDTQVAETKKANDGKAKEHDKVVALQKSWGHRFQVFVDAALTLLIILCVVHFALGIASLFVGPGIGGILKLIGGIVNPFAWFQYIIDHLHLQKALAAAK